MLTFKEYQELSIRTANKNLMPTEQYSMGALGIAGEAGEVADYLKKVLFHSHQLDKETLAKELGDVLWYAAYLASIANLDLGEIAQGNVDKLKKRYPTEFSSELSINRPE